MGRINLIAIGSSTGGTTALEAILPKLKPPLPPIVVVQHIPHGFSKMFADRLNKECDFTVKEGEDREPVKPNFAYIAPGGLHMELKKFGGRFQLHCFNAPPVHSCRPAVDILFHSVAKLVGASALGVILTGIGRDGADGLLEMKKKGSPTLGQDAESCIVYGMPKSAFECGAVDRQVSLNNMALAISTIIHKN